MSIGLTLFGFVATLTAARIAQKANIDVQQTHVARIIAGVTLTIRAAMADEKTDLGGMAL